MTIIGNICCWGVVCVIDLKSNIETMCIPEHVFSIFVYVKNCSNIVLVSFSPVLIVCFSHYIADCSYTLVNFKL